MTPVESEAASRTKLKWAAALQLVQGIGMELLPLLALPVLLITKTDQSVLERGFHFIVPFFNENLYLMMAISGVFGILRIIGAIGLLKNRMLGYTLSVFNCVVTLH